MRGWIRAATAVACGLVSLTAWADRQPAPPVSVQAPVAAAGQNLSVKLGVGPMKVDMLPGDEIGHVEQGGLFCSGRRSIVLSEVVSKGLAQFVAQVTTQELKRLGYPMSGLSGASAFDADVNSAPDFRVGAVIKEVRQDVCVFGNVLEGWLYYKIDWALYSEKEQKVVFQRTTEGMAQSEAKVPDLGKRALLVGIDNFLASPEILEVLRRTPPPAVDPSAKAPADAASGVPASAGMQQEATAAKHWLMLARAKPSPGGAQKNQAKLRSAVVVLETAAGSGSGFYVDREGYLLTDYHVVKGAKFAKVKLPNGDKLVGQVIKVNEHDDVALLKTSAIDFEPLSVRPDVLDVGEDVYAIGSPLGVLTSTVTHGVLSADRVLQGVHLLQSDAAVTFGSSGGPLLDSDGRVVGLTKSGMGEGKGFNLFIPIHDALKALDIGLN